MSYLNHLSSAVISMLVVCRCHKPEYLLQFMRLASPLNLAAIETDIPYEAIYLGWFCMPVLGSISASQM